MKHRLSYGRISWSYDDFDPKVPCVPTPLVRFSPIKINSRLRTLVFTDRQSLELLKHKTEMKLPIKEVYRLWLRELSIQDLELGEGRSFLKWLRQKNLSVHWTPQDYSLHEYFNYGPSIVQDPNDEYARGHSFSISPVRVNNKMIKLYLEDESILNLLSLPYGEEENFLKLMENYILLRFQLMKGNAPAPLFIDWVRANGKKPLFFLGQMGLCLKP
jgi:hypothetical protein